MVYDSNRVAREGALVVALAEEVGEEHGGQEGVLEGDGTEEDANEDEDFGECDDRHGAVIVGFYPNLELLGKRRGSGGTTGSGGRARRQKLGHQGRSCESESVEERENGVGKEGDGNGLGGPPEEGEEEILHVLVSEAFFDIRDLGLGSSKGFVANDGVADQCTGKARFIPPR